MLQVVNTLLQFGLVGIAGIALYSWLAQLRGTTDFNVAHEALICATAVKLAWATASRDSQKPNDFAPGVDFWKWDHIQAKAITDRTDEERLYCAKAIGAMFRLRYQPIEEMLPELRIHAATVVARWPESEKVVREFLWSVQYFQVVSEGLVHYHIQGHNWAPGHENQTHKFAYEHFLAPAFTKFDKALRSYL